MAFDPDTAWDDDHAYIPFVETVTFEARNASAESKAVVEGIGTYKVTTVEAKRLSFVDVRREYGDIIGITSRDTTWRIWCSTLGGNEPTPGDTITSGSDVYKIIDAREERHGSRWLCRTRKRP